MRIAMVAPLVSPITDPPLGGAQTMVADLASGLSARGHTVDVFAAAGSLIDGANVVETGIDASSLRATRFRSGCQQPATGGSEAFQQVYEMVRQRDYKVVHNHAFDPAAVVCARGVDARLIHTLHLPPDRAMAAALAMGRTVEPAPLVTTVSEAQAEEWRRFTSIDAVIRNGIPTGLIPWSERSGAGVVFAGRLSPEKGCREAIEIALAAGVDIDVYGDPYDAEYASAAVEPLRERNGVNLHPPLRRAALWDRMATAEAVLCPAMWDEPFGLIAAEAQAAGTPVVAFRRGGLPEVVDDGVTGFLVVPGDIAAAAAALCQVRRLSRRSCRRHAEVALDLDPVLDAHERLYRQVPPVR